MAIRNDEGTVIAFVCVEYIKKQDAKTELVDKIFKDKQKIFETLLNL